MNPDSQGGGESCRQRKLIFSWWKLSLVCLDCRQNCFWRSFVNILDFGPASDRTLKIGPDRIGPLVNPDSHPPPCESCRRDRFSKSSQKSTYPPKYWQNYSQNCFVRHPDTLFIIFDRYLLPPVNISYIGRESQRWMKIAEGRSGEAEPRGDFHPTRRPESNIDDIDPRGVKLTIKDFFGRPRGVNTCCIDPGGLIRAILTPGGQYSPY